MRQPVVAAMTEHSTAEAGRRRRAGMIGNRTRPRLLGRFARHGMHGVELRTAGWIAVALGILALLMPTLLLPLGPDSAMFFVSAQKILHHGAIHYRDIVDIKPPLIYHLYAGAMLLFGEQAAAIRVFDLLLQLATCWSIVALVRRCDGGDVWAAVSALVYALLYGSLGYAHTMQVESYVGLLLVGTAWATIVLRTPRAFLVAGVLAGIALLLKFPLAVVLGVGLLVEWLVVGSRPRVALRTSALMLAGFVAVALLMVLYLVAGDAAAGFAEVHQYVAGYARTKWSGPGAVALSLTRDVPVFVLRALSLSVLLALIAAILPALRDARSETAPSMRLLQATLVALALLGISLVAEGKFYPYQISRLYAPAAIAAAFSLIRFARALRRLWAGAWSRLVAAGLALAALLVSPIASWLWFTGAPVAALVIGGESAFDRYFDRMAVYYPRSELKQIGAAIRATARPDDEVLTFSSIGALVHHFAGSVPAYRIYHSAFLLADFSPPTWRDEIRDVALREPAFIVVQRGDILFELTANRRSSDALVPVLDLEGLLAKRYTVALETERFILYRRRGDIAAPSRNEHPQRATAP